jgi:hypothetical protein
MALVRTIVSNALLEIGVNQPGESPAPEIAALGLTWVQRMLDAWAANRLTFSRQLRTSFTMSSGATTILIGTGLAVPIAAPVSLNSINYVIPGSSPEVEAPIGQMDEDAFASLSIKELSSALPLQSFYQMNITGVSGTLQLWPEVSQNVTIVIYTPQAIATPASLATDLVGPQGYADAFHYELAFRLVGPLGVAMPPTLPQMKAAAWATMTRPNIHPGVLGIDAALTPNVGGGYNVLSDTTNASR